MPGTSGERESLVIDRSDQPRPQQDTGTQGAVEKVVHSKRGQNLKEEETERETDATRKRRGGLSGTMCDIGMLGEPNDGLMEMCEVGKVRGESGDYLDKERTGNEGNVGD